MKQEIISVPIEIYEHPEELPAPDRELLLRAAQQLHHAYAPYSHFKVGAALSLANSEIITGSNLENAAYPMCLCAEQTAMGAAASRFPHVPILALAVTVGNQHQAIGQPAGPCGACRQIISEAEDRHGRPIRIILRGQTGPVFALRSAKDLLPISFSHEFLKR